MKNLALCMVLSVLSTSVPQLALAEAVDESAQKAVLITGASSGIGRNTAELLASAGYFVYAGARKDADMKALNAIENIMAVRLDVTKQNQIDAAVELIDAEGRGLWGVVNNAGINVIEPLIEAAEENLQFLFDVNVYGVFRVTKAFAPMVIESQGRIVNISSIAGILSGGLDGYGMYMMSKHAVEAYTDQLAWEMDRFGVAALIIGQTGVLDEDAIAALRLAFVDSQPPKTNEEVARALEILDIHLEVPTLLQGHREDIQAAARARMYEDDEYWVATFGDQFLITTKALYKLGGLPEWTLLSEIEAAKDDPGSAKNMMYIQMRSGDVIEYKVNWSTGAAGDIVKALLPALQDDFASSLQEPIQLHAGSGRRARNL